MRVACTCSLQWVAAVNKLSHGVCVCGGGGGGGAYTFKCSALVNFVMICVCFEQYSLSMLH